MSEQRRSRRLVRETRQRLEQVLDSLAITDIEYHSLAYTRPLVLELMVRIVSQLGSEGRVLVVGPDLLLAQALINFGYQVDIWRISDQILPEDMAESIRGVVTPEGLLQSELPGADNQYDAILLPRIFESLRENPRVLLSRIRPLLAEDGVVIGATTNLGRFGARLRALMGKGFLPDWKSDPPPSLDGWPKLKLYRFFQPDEIAAWSLEAGFMVLDQGFVEGHAPFNDALPLNLSQYVFLKLKHALKRTIAPLQDYLVFTLGKPGRDGDEQPEPQQTQLEMSEDFAQFLHAQPEEREELLPFVSVGMPTHNRAHLLPDALASVYDQTYPADRYEVILINDGSTDDTAKVAAEWSAKAPCAIRYVETDGIGAAAARNLCVELAKGDVVAHADDDSRLPPGWLMAGVSAFEPGVALVAGPILPKPEQQFTFFSWSMFQPADNGTYPTSNIFYRRDLFLNMGGFDESFGVNMLGRPVWGWDTDLAWRLRRNGFRAKFCDEALNYHEVFHLSPKRWLLESWRVSMLPAVVRFVPELRRTMLFAHIFLTKQGVYFYLLLLGVVLALAFLQPAWLLLSIPWLADVVKMMRHDWWPPHRWPRILVKLSLLWARFALAGFAGLVGSLRAKRLII